MRFISRATSRSLTLSAVNARSGALRMAAFGLALAAGLSSATAKADTQACINAHASGQREAKAGRLKLASELFTACGSDSSCPEALRGECAELLEKTRAATPTVILSVIDENGGDVSQVKVYSTDDLIVDGLDGRALPLDPGKHRLRFLLPWGDVLSSDVLIREGEKNRLIQVRIEPKTPKEPAPTPATSPEPTPAAPPPPPPQTTPVAAWVATGVAVAGAGVFGTFAVLGSKKKSDLDACAPSCPRSMEDKRDSLKTSYLIADIGLGTAVVSGVVAIYLFATHGSPSDTRAATTVTAPKLTAGFSALPSGGAFVLSGDFR